MSESKENENEPVIKNISPDEAATLIEENMENPNFIILDIRTTKEFQDGHIEGAVNLDYYDDDFQKEIDNGDKEKIYLISCGSGVRGIKTARSMIDAGYLEVYNILGGIRMWKKSKLPITNE